MCWTGCLRRNFPIQFPGTTIVKLEQNYRSIQPILETTNRVIAQSRERYTKDLCSYCKGGERPQLITCVDETDQDNTVIRKVLEHYEQGIPLRKQAVLFRASSHSASLELALLYPQYSFSQIWRFTFPGNGTC